MLKCKRCFYHETLDSKNKLPNEFQIDEFEKISKSMGSFMTGIFCGGEPFIRDDFHEIVKIFQHNNNLIVADSASNGQLTESVVNQTEKILKASPFQKYTLGISLDGFKETHDLIRGEGAYDIAIETWRELQKLQSLHKNFEPYICTTINTIK